MFRLTKGATDIGYKLVCMSSNLIIGLQSNKAARIQKLDKRGRVVQKAISANPGLKFNRLFILVQVQYVLLDNLI